MYCQFPLFCFIIFACHFIHKDIKVIIQIQLCILHFFMKINICICRHKLPLSIGIFPIKVIHGLTYIIKDPYKFLLAL